MKCGLQKINTAVPWLCTVRVPTQSAFFRPDYFLNSTKFIQIGFFFKSNDKRNLHEKCLSYKVAIIRISACVTNGERMEARIFFWKKKKHILGPSNLIYAYVLYIITFASTVTDSAFYVEIIWINIMTVHIDTKLYLYTAVISHR